MTTLPANAHDAAEVLDRRSQTISLTSATAARSSMFINGGACAALLVFFAAIWGETHVAGSIIVGIATALLYYMFGLLLGAMTSGAACISCQWSHDMITRGRVRDAQRIVGLFGAISVAMMIGAWMMFVLGTLITYKCFSMAPALR